jgi:hypothetical protein
MKSFCRAKKTTQHIIYTKKKVLAIYTFDKRLIFRIHKELKKLSSKTTKTKKTLTISKWAIEPGIVVYVYNPISSQTGGSWGQPGLHSRTLSHKTKQTNNLCQVLANMWNKETLAQYWVNVNKQSLQDTVWSFHKKL